MAPVIDFFKIYIDQLRLGKTAAFDEKLSPEFLELSVADELVCKEPIHIVGEAYVADQELILQLKIHTKGLLPCAICNEPVSVDLGLDDFYHVEPLSGIKSGIFDFQQLTREALLLEVPHFAECHGGECPQRKELKKFFKKTSPEDKEETYHPFADLE